MKTIWIVTMMECRLFLRSKASWPLAAFMLLASFMLVVGSARWNAYSIWGEWGMGCMLLTLVLAFSTGNQVQRDRDRRLEGIILSTPTTASTYVCGKYVAGILLLLGFATLNLMGNVLLDAIVPANNYPALGPWPYAASWCVFVLVPLVFGASLTLLITTFTRGQRIVTSMALVLIWLVPVFSGAGNTLANVFNVSGLFLDSTDAAQKLGMTFGSAAAPSPVLAQRVVQLVRVHIPWDHLTSTIWLNRTIFLLLAICCLLGTMRSLHRQRQGF